MATYTLPQLLSQVRAETRDAYNNGDITLSELREKARVRRRNARPGYKATRKRYFTSTKGRKTQREYAQTPKGKETRRNWFQRNPEKGRAQSAKYRAQVLKATPSWVANNPKLMAMMDEKHRIANAFNRNQFLPGRYEVHHIVPLNKGGLNVPWNLKVVSLFDNRSLGSKMPQSPGILDARSMSFLGPSLEVRRDTPQRFGAFLTSGADNRTRLGGAPGRFTGLMGYIPRSR